MIIKIDFNSDEALYVQVCNQIIWGIASSQYHNGDMLPSVRQLAGELGVNMHTVNKAYSVLKHQGFITLNNRQGAVISIDSDKERIREEIKDALRILIAKGVCHDLNIDEIHDTVDEVFSEINKDEI